ncbi:glutathione S-transferase family protein [Myxococcota bacterium]|nr:glutathione S-transferase family protein [Myxococcota bacterium]MCZ7619709.1 glutathione S-transferase family protein [Myxococcota bacterium]
MSDRYRLFGLELSPYSVKVRSYLRYKRIPHEWVVRHMGNLAEFQRHAKLPLIPLVIGPDGVALQDSTPILETLEARFPEPSIHPPDPATRFVSALLEEYGDEWGNKWMFHYRWWYEADQVSAAERIARANLPGAEESAVEKMAAAVRARMVPRLSFVGSSESTRPLIEASFVHAVELLEAHLAGRPFLFGGRPAFADFGLWGQLYNLSTDPTPGALLRARASRTMAWIERMLEPVAEGDFEPWSALAPTLEPLLRDEVAGRFLPWSSANALALEAGEADFTIDLSGQPFTQQVQKYHAKSLDALRKRYRAIPDRTILDPILTRTGCRDWLGPAPR